MDWRWCRGCCRVRAERTHHHAMCCFSLSKTNPPTMCEDLRLRRNSVFACDAVTANLFPTSSPQASSSSDLLFHLLEFSKKKTVRPFTRIPCSVKCRRDARSQHNGLRKGLYRDEQFCWPGGSTRCGRARLRQVMRRLGEAESGIVSRAPCHPMTQDRSGAYDALRRWRRLATCRPGFVSLSCERIEGTYRGCVCAQRLAVQSIWQRP